MSPALRLKSKDRKPEKDVSFLSSQPSSQTLEATVPDSAPCPGNGNRSRYQNPDDANGQNRNLSGGENDSISNGGSWTGESEDHREKPSQQSVLQPDLAAPDRREKIRQKNEKKHQRQKEKRAKELHERCCALLMSGKLEALAQQLVSMGFPHERATKALILNEGKVEESVAWILEGTEDKHKESSIDCRNKLKIDISEELARIKAFETQYMASKQVVERAVVTCAGDLDKIEETLRPKTEEEEPGDPPTIHVQKNLTRMQRGSPPSMTILQQNNEIRGSLMDIPVKTVQMLRKPALKLGLAKPQPVSILLEKRWASPRLNISTSPPMPVTNSEQQYFPVSVGLPYLQLGTIKPGTFVQQHPTPAAEPLPTASAGSPTEMARDEIHNSLETIQQSRRCVGLNPFYSEETAKDQFLNSLEKMQLSQGIIGSNMLYSDIKRPSSIDPSSRISQGNGMLPTLRRAASSLGLFARHTTSVTLDPMDFRNVDWSMDEGSLLSSSSLWPGAGFGNTTGGNLPDCIAHKQESLGAYEEMGYRRSWLLNPGLWDWAIEFEEERSVDVGRRHV